MGRIARASMVYFRDYQWLPVHGHNRFSAYIAPDARAREDVHWELRIHYVAGGAAWRRVQSWERPSLWLSLSGFEPKLRSWVDLERVNFWELEKEDEEALCDEGGWLDADFHSKGGSEENESSFVKDVIWRIAAREAGWFTVELAGFTDGRSLLDNLKGENVTVTPDGKEARYEPDAEFWKKHAELYLVENVPFGTVTVRVPRNARDPEAHALARARTLIGVDEPEHIDVTDYHKNGSEHSETLRDDIFVELQFNGFYED